MNTRSPQGSYSLQNTGHLGFIGPTNGQRTTLGPARSELAVGGCLARNLLPNAPTEERRIALEPQATCQKTTEKHTSNARSREVGAMNDRTNRHATVLQRPSEFSAALSISINLWVHPQENEKKLPRRDTKYVEKGVPPRWLVRLGVGPRGRRASFQCGLTTSNLSENLWKSVWVLIRRFGILPRLCVANVKYIILKLIRPRSVQRSTTHSWVAGCGPTAPPSRPAAVPMAAAIVGAFGPQAWGGRPSRRRQCAPGASVENYREGAAGDSVSRGPAQVTRA